MTEPKTERGKGQTLVDDQKPAERHRLRELTAPTPEREAQEAAKALIDTFKEDLTSEKSR